MSTRDLVLFGSLLVTGCPDRDLGPPTPDIGHRYCADLCQSYPELFDGDPEDPWICTVNCEADPGVSQAFLDCLGHPDGGTSLDAATWEACALLCGADVPPWDTGLW